MKLTKRKARATWLGGVFLSMSLLGQVPVRAATLTAIEVTPANPAIHVGETQQFTATGTYDDGTIQPLVPGVVSLAAGSGHTCAVLYGGEIRCWGENGRGQLGNGS